MLCITQPKPDTEYLEKYLRNQKFYYVLIKLDKFGIEVLKLGDKLNKLLNSMHANRCL